MLYGTENGLKFVEGLDYDPQYYLKSNPTTKFSDYYVPYSHLAMVVDHSDYFNRIKAAPFCPVWNVVKKENIEFFGIKDVRVYYRLNNHRSKK